MDRTKEFKDLVGGDGEKDEKKEERRKNVDDFTKRAERVLRDLDRISQDLDHEKEVENVMIAAYNRAARDDPIIPLNHGNSRD